MSLRSPDTSARGARQGAGMNIRSFLSLSVLGLVACSEAGPNPAPAKPAEAPAVAPSSLDAAHEAYLKGDWLGVGDRIRDVLLDRTSGDLAKANALELLDKSYEATEGKMPSRFTLPRGFLAMKLGALRGQHAWSTYRTLFLFLRFEKGLGAHVKDVTVRSLPAGTVLLDRASGTGALRLSPQEDSDEVVLEAKDVAGPVPDGVTSIHVTLDDGREADTWVLARGLGSSASPEITTPSQSATFTEASPTFAWSPFVSPEYARFEDRTLSIYVSDEKSKKVAFDHWIWQPGDLARIKVEPKLAPGSYWLALTAGEERGFGPVRLARSSQRGVPFSVVP